MAQWTLSINTKCEFSNPESEIYDAVSYTHLDVYKRQQIKTLVI